MEGFPGNRNTPELKLLVNDTLPLDVDDINIEVEGCATKWKATVLCDLKLEEVLEFKGGVTWNETMRQ